VQQLWADHAVAHANEILPAHRQFIRMAAKHPFHPCLIDSSVPGGRKLSYGRSLAASVMLGRMLRPMLGDTQNVGIWLPPSVGGALANISLAILGKTSVNLNYSSSPVVVQASIRQAGIRHVLTSRKSARLARCSCWSGRCCCPAGCWTACWHAARGTAPSTWRRWSSPAAAPASRRASS
jgi:acyl-[acyl-carrier-protein]-phospholipid O-acyltransferase/long-chain-fatty-acid--[acyl-carrier-protein] ligase